MSSETDREAAKAALRSVINTALHNVDLVERSAHRRTEIAEAVLDQISSPGMSWALKELAKPLPQA